MIKIRRLSNGQLIAALLDLMEDGIVLCYQYIGHKGITSERNYAELLDNSSVVVGHESDWLQFRAMVFGEFGI